MSWWIKCSERMPEDFRHVMVIRAGYERGHSYYFAYRARGEWIKNDIHCTPLEGITHWMPLPPPPAD